MVDGTSEEAIKKIQRSHLRSYVLFVYTQKFGTEQSVHIFHMYRWGNGHAEWCLECDTPSHASPACPRIRASYPPSIVPLLPAIENWMMEDLERVQSLDRARAWIKVMEKDGRKRREQGREAGRDERKGRRRRRIRDVHGGAWVQRKASNSVLREAMGEQSKWRETGTLM